MRAYTWRIDGVGDLRPNGLFEDGVLVVGSAGVVEIGELLHQTDQFDVGWHFFCEGGRALYVRLTPRYARYWGAATRRGGGIGAAAVAAIASLCIAWRGRERARRLVVRCARAAILGIVASDGRKRIACWQLPPSSPPSSSPPPSSRRRRARTPAEPLAMLDQAARKPLRVHANSQRRARGPSALKASVADRILFSARVQQKDSQRRKKSIRPRSRSARLFVAAAWVWILREGAERNKPFFVWSRYVPLEAEALMRFEPHAMLHAKQMERQDRPTQRLLSVMRQVSLSLWSLWKHKRCYALKKLLCASGSSLLSSRHLTRDFKRLNTSRR